MNIITIAQIKVIRNDIDKNLSKIISTIKNAKKAGSSLVVFPEMSLSGYFLSEEELQDIIPLKINNAIEIIHQAIIELDIDAIISYPVVEYGDRFIEAAYISPKGILGKHRKIYLANYGHCTDHHYYKEGSTFQIIDSPVGKVGMLLCEDGWHMSTPIILAQLGAELILNLSATSAEDESLVPIMQNGWEIISKGAAFSQRLNFLYLNRVGHEGCKKFIGGSHLVSPEGEILEALPAFEEKIVHIPVSTKSVHEARENIPLVKNELSELNAKYFDIITEVSFYETCSSLKSPQKP